jgi:ras-like protein family member 10A
MQNIPVYVVGNKADLCTSVLNNMRGSHHHGHYHHHHTSQFHHHSSHHTDHDITPAFKELASLVRKQWKCNYLECSAKYNWRLIPIFKDILKTIEANQRTLEMSSAHRDQEHHDSLKFSITTASGHFSTTTHSTRSSVPMRTSNTINSSSCVII